ncbi:MAG: hypothetical protein PHN77_15130 [Thermoguttaceae bacterium]|nr:hypothetical protein [Thermoguttaceae bacterium]
MAKSRKESTTAKSAKHESTVTREVLLTKEVAAPGKRARNTGCEQKSEQGSGEQEVLVDRRRADRRVSGERRASSEPVAVERRKLQRRAKVNRRRQIDPTTCERDYSEEEVEFMNALDEYKRNSGRMFPTCSEILEVIRDLGYAKAGVRPAEEIGLALVEQSQQPNSADIPSLA